MLNLKEWVSLFQCAMSIQKVIAMDVENILDKNLNNSGFIKHYLKNFRNLKRNN